MKTAMDKARERAAHGDWKSVARHAQTATERAPLDADAWHLLGLAHLKQNDNGPALQSLAHALKLRMPFPEAMLDLSVACNRTGEHEMARGLCEMLLTLAPGSTAAWLNLGMALKGLGRPADAAAAFESAGDHPMARFNLGHTLLLMGDLERGLPLFEHRRTVLRTGAGLAGRPWTGEALPGATLLVIPEQGLGDVLLMSRFFAPLADRFARVVIQAPAPLVRLVASLDPRLVVVTDAAGAHHDVWAPVMSLPHLMGVTSYANLPVEPWIHADAPVHAPGPRPRIGLNWAGNPSYAYDAVRSTSLESFSPLLAIADVEWVSLHRGVREHEAEAYGLPQPLLGARDFMDTANVIAGCDLVISTETAIPNLSAAMGVPTCVLGVKDIDWRWRGWFRDVTVCDQDAPGNWFGPLAKSAEAIKRLLLARAAA